MSPPWRSPLAQSRMTANSELPMIANIASGGLARPRASTSDLDKSRYVTTPTSANMINPRPDMTRAGMLTDLFRLTASIRPRPATGEFQGPSYAMSNDSPRNTRQNSEYRSGAMDIPASAARR